MLRKCLILLVSLVLSQAALAQSSDFKSITIDGEFRSRLEMRNGYSNLRYANEQPAFHVNQRSRIIGHLQNSNLTFHTSIQDIRIWGEEDTRANKGGLMVFETWIEPRISKSWTLRIGRQVITLDDERIFAVNEWRSTSGKHDAIRAFYTSKKLNMQMAAAYNQTDDFLSLTTFDPGFDTYLFLGFHYLDFNPGKRLRIRSLNLFDAYQNTANNAIYGKLTSGGILDFHVKKLGFMLESYYQLGHIISGEKHNAYFIHPQINYAASKYKSSLGTEILSGTNQNEINAESHSFLAQYSAFHTHNGRMDYSAQLVRNYMHEGLIDAYYMHEQTLNAKQSIKLELHSYALNSIRTNSENRTLKPYWGSEIDVRYFFKISNITTIELSYMTIFATETRASLYGGNPKAMQQFAYVQIHVKPNLWHTKNELKISNLDQK